MVSRMQPETAMILDPATIMDDDCVELPAAP